jgi:hypothetical protein
MMMVMSVSMQPKHIFRARTVEHGDTGRQHLTSLTANMCQNGLIIDHFPFLHFLHV